MRKNIISFSLLISVLFISSCNKKEKDVVLTDPSFSAKMNGSDWKAASSWANYSVNTKRFVIAGIKGDEHLHLNFKTADISESSPVTNFDAEWNYVVGGDAVSDSYLIDPTFNNLIEITSLDTITKKISGTFIVKLIRDKRRSDKGETQLYKNGQFKQNYTVTE